MPYGRWECVLGSSQGGGKNRFINFKWACPDLLEKVNLARLFAFTRKTQHFIRGPPFVFHFKNNEMEGRRMPEWIRIKICDYYKNAIGEQKYTYVSPEVYEALANDFRKEAEAERKRDERNRAVMNYEDGETDDLLLIQQESVEEQVLRELEIQTLQKGMLTLTKVQKERLHLYFFKGMTTREIAEYQGGSQNVVWKSIQSAVNNLKKFLD